MQPVHQNFRLIATMNVVTAIMLYRKGESLVNLVFTLMFFIPGIWNNIKWRKRRPITEAEVDVDKYAVYTPYEEGGGGCKCATWVFMAKCGCEYLSIPKICDNPQEADYYEEGKPHFCENAFDREIEVESVYVDTLCEDCED
jgi:hypothetical protein